MADKPERFWRGAIQSRPHAEKVIRFTAVTFLALAALSALTLLQTFSVGKILTVLMIGMPALSLLRQRGIVSASLLLALCALAVALCVGFAYALPMPLVVAGAFWLPLAYVAWRGFIAARFIRANRFINATA